MLKKKKKTTLEMNETLSWVVPSLQFCEDWRFKQWDRKSQATGSLQGHLSEAWPGSCPVPILYYLALPLSLSAPNPWLAPRMLADAHI